MDAPNGQALFEYPHYPWAQKSQQFLLQQLTLINDHAIMPVLTGHEMACDYSIINSR